MRVITARDLVFSNISLSSPQDCFLRPPYRNGRGIPDLNFLISFLFTLDWGAFPQLFLVFLKTEIVTLHRKASLIASEDWAYLRTPQG